jgi:hypothetical protein
MLYPRFCHQPIAAGIFLLTSTIALAASAAESTPIDDSVKWPRHFAELTLHTGASALLGDIDGHRPHSDSYWGVGGRYTLGTRFLDLGAGVDYFTPMSSRDNRYAIAASLSVRPHVALGHGVELGLSLLGGWSWFVWPDMSDENGGGVRHNHVFTGLYLGIMPDVRIRLTPHIALDLGPEAHLISGNDYSGIKSTYLDTGAAMLMLGGFARVVVP